MKTLLVTCGACGRRTLTTHAACIHCAAPLAEAGPAEDAVCEPPLPGASSPPEPAAAPAVEDQPAGRPTLTRRPLPQAAPEKHERDTVWPPRMRQPPARPPMSGLRSSRAQDEGRQQPHLRGKCPHGHGALTPASLGERPAQLCPQCSGLWLTHGDFGAFVRHLAQQTLELEPLPPGATVPSPGDRAEPMPCPSCTAPLSRRVLAGFEDHPLAQCERHGVWIDDDELRALMRRIASASADEARRLAAPDLREDRP